MKLISIILIGFLAYSCIYNNCNKKINYKTKNFAYKIKINNIEQVQNRVFVYADLSINNLLDTIQSVNLMRIKISASNNISKGAYYNSYASTKPIFKIPVNKTIVISLYWVFDNENINCNNLKLNII